MAFEVVLYLMSFTHAFIIYRLTKRVGMLRVSCLSPLRIHSTVLFRILSLKKLTFINVHSFKNQPVARLGIGSPRPPGGMKDVSL